MKTKIYLFLLLCASALNAQTNYALDNLITNSHWNTLFPKRAGTYGIHPQGYTSDFYSYNNLRQAIIEMSDYLVNIRKKPNVWGELITITKKSTNQIYTYSQVESWWYTNTTPEVSINVDFEDFLNSTNTINNKRELAAFLANISKETTGGWQLPVGGGSQGDYAQWGLYFVHEVGYSSTSSAGAYSQPSTDYPPNSNKGYYGRGPIQLSWNYNYGQLSKFLYNDISILLNNPDLVQQDGVLAFKSAIWFWMMPQWPKPSCHQVMHELWSPLSNEYSAAKMYKKGFAHVNNIINGGLECRSASTSVYTQKVIIRSDLYKYYMGILGFTAQEISNENSGDYSSLCYESSSNAMQDYTSAYLGISNFNLEEFKLYPNPVDDYVNIKYNTEITNIEFYNTAGSLMFSTNPFSKDLKINISFLPKGIYILNLRANSQLATFTLIKK